MEDYKKLLECPVCFETLTAPVQTCDNGHAMCRVCKNSFVNCPICKSNFNELKNTLLNQLIESCPESCLNAPNGCLEIVSKSNKTTHENNCNYKLVRCAEIDCKETGFIYCKLNEHIKLAHGYTWDNIQFEEEIRLEVDIENRSNSYVYLLHEHKFRKFFFLEICT